MKVKTDLYGVFYNNRGKWVGPAHGELFTKEQIVENYDTEYNFIEGARKQYRKRVILMRQVWEE